MEPQSTQEKLMPVKLFFGGRNNAIAGLDSNLITTPGTQYICTYILVNASQVPPLSIRHTGGSTDLLRYRIRGVNMKRGSATECQKGFLRRVCSSHMLIRSGTLGEIWGHLDIVNPPNIGAYGLSAARSHLLSLDGLERSLTLGGQTDLGDSKDLPHAFNRRF